MLYIFQNQRLALLHPHAYDHEFYRFHDCNHTLSAGLINFSGVTLPGVEIISDKTLYFMGNINLHSFICKLFYLGAVLFFVLLLFPVSAIPALLVKKYFPFSFEDYYEQFDLVSGLAGYGMQMVYVYILCKFEKISFLNFPQLRIRPLITSIGLGVCVWIMGELLLYFINPGANVETIHGWYGVCNYMISFIVASAAEELFFRGWLLGYMEKKSFSRITIVLTISIIFFLFHYDGVHSVFSRLDAFVLSVLACCMYFKTRDLRYCILMHMTMNFIVSMRVIIPYFLDV